MDNLILKGVRVVDLTFNRVGPTCTAMLAALGAEVIRAESFVRIDPNRLTQVTADNKMVYADAADIKEMDTRWTRFNTININKLGVRLNLKAPGMKDLLKKLVQVSDLVVESFHPQVMENWGLGYGVLRQWRPDIILISVNGFGRGGPQEHYRAYANIFAAGGGLDDLTGYPDRAPIGYSGSMDSVVGCWAAMGALSALLERDETGRGQHVDTSGSEGVTTLLGGPVMEYLLNGRSVTRRGNRVEGMAPHNCYRCQNADDLVAIAVGTQEEWQALCKAMGHPELAHDPRFVDVAGRTSNIEALDEIIEKWTMGSTSYRIAELLQDAGVAAFPSMRPEQLFNDPHVKERGVWVKFTQPIQGERHDVRIPWLFSDGSGTYGPSPLFGQHNGYIYGELLGMKRDELIELEGRKITY